MEYSDEFAVLTQRVKVLELLVSQLERTVADLRAGVERQADYQGVRHLLAPQ